MADDLLKPTLSMAQLVQELAQDTGARVAKVGPKTGTWVDVFESLHPGGCLKVDGIELPSPTYVRVQVHIPDIELHCPSRICNGVRVYSPQAHLDLKTSGANDVFVRFACRNCRISMKLFALECVWVDDSRESLFVTKLGETPPFGPPSPAKLISLVGVEREYFLRGRRCELQGLGIGAFSYYRRVVEHQKGRIFEEIIKVSRKMSAPAELVLELEQAKLEVQFSAAVAKVKHALPQVLLVDGHNPLTVLHAALSDGLHAQSDADCLELATTIRLVLVDFVERVETALKDQAGLTNAVGRLLRSKHKSSRPPDDPSTGE